MKLWLRLSRRRRGSPATSAGNSDSCSPRAFRVRWVRKESVGNLVEAEVEVHEALAPQPQALREARQFVAANVERRLNRAPSLPRVNWRAGVNDEGGPGQGKVAEAVASGEERIESPTGPDLRRELLKPASRQQEDFQLPAVPVTCTHDSQ